MKRRPKEAFIAKFHSDVTKYFDHLGYTVTWDFNRAQGTEWWEIMKNGKLVVQIDIHAPLAAIKEDFVAFRNGSEKGTSNVGYTVSGPDTPELRELFQKVAEDTQN